jgi:hypothetical protein
VRTIPWRAACAAGPRRTLAERWDGHRRQVERAPDVNRIGYTVLDAVSCAAECVVVASGKPRWLKLRA